ADVEASDVPRTACGVFPRPSRPVRQAIIPTARIAQHIPAKTNRSTKRIATPLTRGAARLAQRPHSLPCARPTPSETRLPTLVISLGDFLCQPPRKWPRIPAHGEVALLPGLTLGDLLFFDCSNPLGGL